MSGFEKFKNAILAALFNNIKASVVDKDQFFHTVVKSLLDSKSPIVKLKQNPYQRYFSMLFYGWTEIITSYDVLLNIEVYTQRFPYKEAEVTNGNYLRYHIGNYLNELYILEKRLTSYISRIARANRKSPNRDKYEETNRLINDLTEKSFANAEKNRGIHVHEHHFSGIDIERLEAQKVFVDIGLDGIPEYKDSYQSINKTRNSEMQKIRRIWNTQIITNNQVIKKILDSYFDIIYPLVFDKDGNVIFE
jgi:hypothetical protein